MSEKLPETIGIIGGGQLGRMLAQAAIPLGFQVNALQKNSHNSPAHQVGAIPIEGSITDPEAITRLVEMSDVTTWEIEHIDAGTLLQLNQDGFDIQSDPAILELIKDKFVQKQRLKSFNFPVAPFMDKFDDEKAVAAWGPCVVKSKTGGYDGRGNLVVDSLTDPRITEKFGSAPIYAESIIDFDKELSVIVARGKDGVIATYPVIETIHENNICHTVISPARISPELAGIASELARDVARKFLKGAGVFAIEMFAVGNNVIINEIAPRVHNSGHHTIEANKTSQFEQHIRAVTGLPLGSTEQRARAAVMVNVLGTKTGPIDRTGLSRVTGIGDTHVHLYGKTPRLERKIGHITVLADNTNRALQKAKRARDFLEEL